MTIIRSSNASVGVRKERRAFTSGETTCGRTATCTAAARRLRDSRSDAVRRLAAERLQEEQDQRDQQDVDDQRLDQHQAQDEQEPDVIARAGIARDRLGGGGKAARLAER